MIKIRISKEPTKPNQPPNKQPTNQPTNQPTRHTQHNATRRTTQTNHSAAKQNRRHITTHTSQHSAAQQITPQHHTTHHNTCRCCADLSRVDAPRCQSVCLTPRQGPKEGAKRTGGQVFAPGAFRFSLSFVVLCCAVWCVGVVCWCGVVVVGFGGVLSVVFPLRFPLRFPSPVFVAVGGIRFA